jgi:hypothetical protein
MEVAPGRLRSAAVGSQRRHRGAGRCRHLQTEFTTITVSATRALSQPSLIIHRASAGLRAKSSIRQEQRSKLG